MPFYLLCELFTQNNSVRQPATLSDQLVWIKALSYSMVGDEI